MSNYKKYLAGMLAASMVVGSAFTAFAADKEGEGTGTGSLDILEQSDIFDVVVPTDSGTTFNYILDPTGVIAKTDAAKYNGADFASGKTVYFGNASGGAAESGVATQSGGAGGAGSYSELSDKITAVNKSTMDVDISVSATVEEVEGITMVESDTFAATDKKASLYLALKDAKTTSAIKADGGAKLTSTIKALDGAYETAYENGKYTQKLKDGVTGFEEYSFQLTGACNPNGDWEGLTEEPPTVTVVWTVKDPTAGPQVTMTSDGVITMSGLTAEANFAHSAVLTYGDLSDELDTDPNMEWDVSSWSVDNGGTLIFKLSPAWLNALKGKSAKVTVSLTNDTTIDATCQF